MVGLNVPLRLSRVETAFAWKYLKKTFSSVFDLEIFKFHSLTYARDCCFRCCFYNFQYCSCLGHFLCLPCCCGHCPEYEFVSSKPTKLFAVVFLDVFSLQNFQFIKNAFQKFFKLFSPSTTNFINIPVIMSFHSSTVLIELDLNSTSFFPRRFSKSLNLLFPSLKIIPSLSLEKCPRYSRYSLSSASV